LTRSLRVRSKVKVSAARARARARHNGSIGVVACGVQVADLDAELAGVAGNPVGELAELLCVPIADAGIEFARDPTQGLLYGFIDPIIKGDFVQRRLGGGSQFPKGSFGRL
jgi:hypothetical protein